MQDKNPVSQLWEVYSPEIPEIASEIIAAPEMQRLRDVGMNCGCEYTDFPRFRTVPPYSRYDHSVGVSLIVWKFTRDPAQTAAGLFHDIATPCFAHVVDFLRGDHLTQESTEDGTESIIKNSPVIMPILEKYGLSVPAVSDYHIYPVADNDTPRLSADRLEYSLGNILNFGFREIDALRAYYADLTVGENDEGAPEIMFRSADVAREFFLDAMKCNEIYVSDTDRFIMQALAELLGRAISRGAICENDLSGTEPAIIAKLLADPASRSEWETFRAYKDILRAEKPGPEPMWRMIPAKKRYIDPFVQNKGRVSKIFPDCGEYVKEFLARRQDYWVMGI